MSSSPAGGPAVALPSAAIHALVGQVFACKRVKGPGDTLPRYALITTDYCEAASLIEDYVQAQLAAAPERPYAANDHAIEIGELTKQRDELAAALAWLGDPAIQFHYSVRSDRTILVETDIPGDHVMLGVWPNLLAAITEAKRRIAEAAPRAARRAAQEARS